jgi:hypothetical protein
LASKRGEGKNKMPILAKESYESRKMLKPKSKKNLDGVVNGSIALIEDVEETTLPVTGKTYMMKFKQYKLALPLNKTNLQSCVSIFGSNNTDKWVGREVMLVNVLANNPKGGETLSIRIKPKDYVPGEDEE